MPGDYLASYDGGSPGPLTAERLEGEIGHLQGDLEGLLKQLKEVEDEEENGKKRK